MKEETERVIPGLRPPRENKMKSILRALDDAFPDSLNESELEDKTGIKSINDFLTYANEEDYLEFEDGDYTLEPEGQAYLSELEQTEANRVRKNTETILTVFLVLATLTSAFVGYQTYQINQERTNLEQIATDYMQPQPTCSWTEDNDSMNFMLSNTGSNAYLVANIYIDGAYLLDGYYGVINRTLGFTTGSHPVIPSEANKKYSIHEDRIPITISGDTTTIDGIAQVRDVKMGISKGDRTFSSANNVERIDCIKVRNTFFEPTNQ